METPAGWTASDKGLVKEFVFSDFASAVRFINAVAGLAESLDHHPDIHNSYTKVTLTLFTHDKSAITEKDIALALEIDALG